MDFDEAGAVNEPADGGQGTPLVAPPVNLPSLAASALTPTPPQIQPYAGQPPPGLAAPPSQDVSPLIAALMQRMQPAPPAAPPSPLLQALRSAIPLIAAAYTGARGMGAEGAAKGWQEGINAQQAAQAAQGAQQDREAQSTLRIAEAIRDLQSQQQQAVQVARQQQLAEHQQALEQLRAQQLADENTRSAARLGAVDKAAQAKQAQEDYSRAWNDFAGNGGLATINKLVDTDGPAAAQSYLQHTTAAGLPGVTLADLFAKRATLAPDGAHYIQGTPQDKVPVLGSEADVLGSYARDVLGIDPKDMTFHQRMAAMTAQTAAKKPEDEPAPTLSPAALKLTAQQYAMTGQLPPMGMGKQGAAVRSAIINQAAQIYDGLDLPSQVAAYQANKSSLVKVQGQSDALNAFQRTAGANLTNFLAAAEKIPDTGSPWLNKPLREINQQGMGSADQAAFTAARDVVLPEFARIITNPNMTGVLSDKSRDSINSLSPESASLNQIKAVAKILVADSQNRADSYQTQMADIRARIAKKPGSADPTPTPIAGINSAPAPGTTIQVGPFTTTVRP